MLIQSLAQKTRLALLTVLAAVGGCVLICGFTLWRCIALVTEERQQIYVLDGDIPFAQRAQLEANFTNGSSRAYPTVPPVLFQSPSRQRLYQVDCRKGYVYGRWHGIEAETGYGRERILLGYNLFIGSLHNHLRFDQL